MWSNGAVEVKNKFGKKVLVEYWCKHFEEPSEDYGIEGGRISKLTLKQGKNEVYNYDRGLDIEPQTREAEQSLEILMKRYN